MDGNGLRLVRLLGDDLILPAAPILGLDGLDFTNTEIQSFQEMSLGESGFFAK